MELELFSEADSLQERLAAAVQARALLSLVKDAQKRTDRALRESVDDVSRVTGTKFTARDAGWSAVVTDPQPRPVVADREAFGRWGNYETVSRVEVRDHAAATAFVRWCENRNSLSLSLDGLAETALGALRIVTDYVLPEDPFTPLIDAGRIKVTTDHVVDLETGEPVPGTTVQTARSELRVTGTKDAKAAARRQLADRLGIPAEIGGQ